MKKLIKLKTLGLLLIIFLPADTKAQKTRNHYPVKPVPFTDVQLRDEFFRPRLETNRKVTIPHCLKKCEQTGRIDNFAIAGGLKKGSHKGHIFNDSDLYKVIEGIAYSLVINPDPELEKYTDRIIEKIAAAQENDGYLYTARTINPHNPRGKAGKKRFSKLRYSHELYNLGHLYEAAVAYYKATGKHTLLKVATKSADLLTRTFGPDKMHKTSGHEEIEIGLQKLYDLSGEEKYLSLAKFFIEQRGHHQTRESYKAFRQDHKPLTGQSKAVGHAVSGAYFYAAAAELAGRTGNQPYKNALERIWKDVVTGKLYITAVAAAPGETFSKPYRLPNLKGYNETCAAIALAIWNYKMFQLSGDAKYLDLFEIAVYNAILSGISLTGDKFFYSNPLASDGKYKFNGIDIPDEDKTASRMDWFICACCPTNLVRFIPSIPKYAYAKAGDGIYINLFITGLAKIKTENNNVKLNVQTKYPYHENVKITVEPETSRKFLIYIRIPGWTKNKPIPGSLYHYLKKSKHKVTLKVNGRPVALNTKKGFAPIHRKWKSGDTIEINIPMPVRRVLCNQKVQANRGKVALQRGPIVYCLEWFDNSGDVSDIKVPQNESFKVTYMKEALGGISLLKAEKSGFLAIPYYAWSNRGQGEMTVWIQRKDSQ